MSRINTLPQGFQFLLGNTNQGENPADLDPNVSAGIDMFPFWGLNYVDYVAFIGQIGAVFQQQFIQVPEGELWIPLSMSGEAVTTIIGEEIQFVIGIADRANLQRVSVSQSQGVASTTAQESYNTSHEFASIQPVRAGEKFFFQCRKFNAAGARNIALRLRFIRLKI